MNLLKSLYFLPIKARLDFYYKVVFPSVIYGLVWNTPTEEVRTKYNWKTLKNTY